MANAKFKIITNEYQYPNAGSIGVLKDASITNAAYGLYTWLDEYGALPNGGIICLQDISNFGNGPILLGHNGEYLFGVLELRMPTKEDLINGGNVDIHEVTLRLTWSGSWRFGTIPGFLVVGIKEIEDDFTEGVVFGRWPSGTLPPIEAWCNWNKAKDGIPWVGGGGIVKSRGSLDVNDGTPLDSARIVCTVYASPPTITLSVDLKITEAVSFGDLKRFIIFVLDSDGDNLCTWGAYSNEAAVAANRPKVLVKYKDYAVEAFADKDSALTIEPNPDNPEQPLLKWGGVKDADFVDFKVYRETSAITTVAALTPIATITSPADQEYIDTYAHVDGTTYYYLVIAEDGNNTGDDATKSNQIVWKKPAMTVRTVTAGNVVVGTSKTATVTSVSKIKRIYVDWGDGSTSWYEYEVAALTQTATHIYSKALTTFTPYLQMEDVDGFWSDLLATTNSIAITDTTATAKLRVSVKKGILEDWVTLDASLSQPAGSNVTIDEYYFKRYAGDGYSALQTSPIFTFQTLISEGFEADTLYTAGVKIICSSGQEQTDTATYILESGTATPLVFSRSTKIHELNHDLSMDKMVEIPIGSAGVAHEFLISRPPERITLVGTSNHPDTGTDIGKIRAAWLANTFVSFTINSEMEGKVVTYSGMIDGDISLGQSYNNKQSWTFPFRVITRAEA